MNNKQQAIEHELVRLMETVLARLGGQGYAQEEEVRRGLEARGLHILRAKSRPDVAVEEPARPDEQAG